MKERIRERLKELEDRENFRILHAVESGSRAWGFASADSDYDVRFLYVWPEDRYLTVHPPPDQFDFGVDDDLIDLSGWDLRKSLALFARSNGALLEWMHSPIVYKSDEETMDCWRALLPSLYSVRASASHYAGLAKSVFRGIEESGPATTSKKYLYVLRSLICAQSVLENGKPPPVAFLDLLKTSSKAGEVRDKAARLILGKEDGKESDPTSRDEDLEAWIGSELEDLAFQIEGLPGDAEHDLKALDHFFRSVIRMSP